MLQFQSPPSPISQKVLGNEPPPGSPMESLMERIVCFQSVLLDVSQVPYKSSPDKKKFLSLSQRP